MSTVYFTRRCREDSPRRINQCESLGGGCGMHQFEGLGTNEGVVDGKGQGGVPEEV